MIENFNTIKPETEDVEKVPKSERYKNFPDSNVGWGEDIRENHPDKLRDAIRARIKHMFNLVINPFLSDSSIDESLSISLETEFNELAQKYLSIEGDILNSFAIQKKLELAFEEIHKSALDSSEAYFNATEERYSKEERLEFKIKGLALIEETIQKTKDLKHSMENLEFFYNK